MGVERVNNQWLYTVLESLLRLLRHVPIVLRVFRVQLPDSSVSPIGRWYGAVEGALEFVLDRRRTGPRNWGILYRVRWRPGDVRVEQWHREEVLFSSLMESYSKKVFQQ